jgi:hypothetical protein
MRKFYAIDMDTQENEIDAYCFGQCGEVVSDWEIEAHLADGREMRMLFCKITKCPFAEKEYPPIPSFNVGDTADDVVKGKFTLIVRTLRETGNA